MARLKGQTVVVKVQRPGLKALFDIDLKNVRLLAKILQAADPKSDGAARDWVAIYDECSRILYEEIDYVKEASNARRFKTNFSKVDWVKVPDVYWEYTTPEVLVMEYCPGVKINNGPRIDELGINRQQLARYAVESYLQQILQHGFFHADPHPGNVSVDAVNGGRLIYYDFGMMGTIPGNIKNGLVELFYAVYEKDVERCVEALVEMGVLVRGGDMTAIRRTGEFFLNSFSERLDEQRKERESNPEKYQNTFKGPRSKEEASQVRKRILANIGEDLLVTAADQPFRFPAEFTFVVRAFSVLDGIGKSLDSRFDISEIAAPYARDFVLEGRPQLKKLTEDLKRRAVLQKRACINLFRGPNMIEDMNGILRQMERGELKLRVRALEAERALSRVEVWQGVLLNGLMASTFINVGTLLKVQASSLASNFAFALALFFTTMSLTSYLKIKKLEKKEKQISGTMA